MTHQLTLANPSAVPVCVPKKIVTFFLPSSTSSSRGLITNGLSVVSTRLELFPEEPPDLLQTSMTMQPMRTAMEVVTIMARWRFSVRIELNSAATDS
ncbi:hypothetical protein HID58_000679 [Brassica napus]|uniref:Uncharacterized protein n=1 Tax=Brassica napus TaxID=3708 RepID=A0ABQ8EH78_BRANA|nr:hypothetical protein HID58_000679 [Brassica napus]